MDYKNENNKEDFEIFKENTFKKFLVYLNNIEYKKSVLITYWINSFRNYLKSEETFNSIYLPVYKQGSIVEIDLGFNIGSEQGGLHYAIVINNNDTKKNPVLTIIPLSSIKSEKQVENLKEFEIYIGNEIYLLMHNNLLLMQNQFNENINDLKDKINEIKKNKDYDENKIKNLDSELKKYSNYVDSIDKGIKKINKLESGSYAIINQITTISKIRVKAPLNNYSHLHNLVISDISINNIKKNLKKFMKL